MFRLPRNKIGLVTCSLPRVRPYSSSHSKPPVDENGLYFGQFTKQEYDEAAAHVKSQIDAMHQNIVGTSNVRDSIGKRPQFPQRDPRGPSAVSPQNIKNLSDFFAQTIKTGGPISLSAYMRQCLTHPQFGYYTTRDPLARNTGDFITSPEISSVFGEMIGLWLFSTYTAQKSPPRIRIIEFGPGRGTLVHDMLKVFIKLYKRSPIDIEINLIEASPILRQEQWKMLCSSRETPVFHTDETGFQCATSKWNNTVRWLDTEKDVATLEAGIPNYVISHEFFDALPIKGFQKTEHGWRELLVEHSPSVVNTQPKLPPPAAPESEPCDQRHLETEFHLTLANKETPSSMIPKLNKRYDSLPMGSRIEVCPEAELYILKMASLLDNERSLGAVLVIDYGLVNAIPENSLRGIYQHQFVSPFYKPGHVDLSADVDFDSLIDATQKSAASFGPIDQGDWLHNAGIGYRIDQLLRSHSEDEGRQDEIYKLYRRLTDKDADGMGKIYKFLCLMPLKSKAPLGFLTGKEA